MKRRERRLSGGRSPPKSHPRVESPFGMPVSTVKPYKQSNGLESIWLEVRSRETGLSRVSRLEPDYKLKNATRPFRPFGLE